MYEKTVAVSAIIYGGYDLLLCAPSVKLGGKLTTPGGKVDKRESLIDALIREVYEETGVKVVCKDTNYKGYADTSDCLVHFFYIGFLALDEIKNTEPDKLGAWRYVNIMDEFENLIEGLQVLYSSRKKQNKFSLSMKSIFPK